jgi:endonuclease I
MRKVLISILIAVFALCSFAETLQPGFYDKIDGLQDGQLKDTLKFLIRDHTAINYGSQTWNVFYYSDRDEEGYCMDMYCDDWYKFTSPGTAVTGCNIEHSFAKSWWGGNSNDAYKDCYHLNPSNSTANSARSNYPLGVPVKEIKSNTGSLKVGKMHHPTMDVDFWVFEPKDEYKGDFARAYFYMATCYGHWSNGQIDPVLTAYQGWRLDNKDVGSKFAMQNDNYLEFQPWEQEVLIAWHRQDPVSIKEIRRMDAVSNFQHNRNPFIDYPFLAEYIWGSYAGETVDMSHLMASSDEEFVPGVSNGWKDGDTPQPQKPKFGVSWSVNGTVIQVDSIFQNKKIPSLPSSPESCSATSELFMGWSPTSISGSMDEAPEKLYTTAAEIPSVTEDLTLYAVFAHKTVIDGGEAVSLLYDDEHQAGWQTNANYGSYLLLDQGKTLSSPEINLAGLDSIIVKIRTYGGKSYNTLNVTANETKLTDIVTTTGSTMTEYTWVNDQTLSGRAMIVFSSNYGANKGIGVQSVRIVATGTRVLYSDYITFCGTTDVENRTSKIENRKLLINGQLYIRVGEMLYTITGQRVSK